MSAALWTAGLRRGLPADGAGSRPADRPMLEDDLVAKFDQDLRDPDAQWVRAYARCASPFGTVHVAASAAGVCAVSSQESEFRFRTRVGANWWRSPGALPKTVAAQAEAELAEYFAGRRRRFDVAIDLPAVTAFEDAVLAAIAAIPYGATRTYGEVGEAIGRPGAARAVGLGCAGNPVPFLIPCHRVVRADGRLGGYGAGGPRVKAALLAMEGARLLG